MPKSLVRHRMIPVPFWLSAGMRDNKACSTSCFDLKLLSQFSAPSVN